MAQSRARKSDKKKSKAPRKKCVDGCTCGRHKKKSADPVKNPPKKQKRTEVKQSLFIDALRQTAGIIEPALEMAQIARSTYRKWYNDEPEFAQRVDDVTAAQHDFVETKLMKGIKMGSERLIEFYLDRRVPNYAKKSSLDIKSNGKDIQTPTVVFMPFDDDSDSDKQPNKE